MYELCPSDNCRNSDSIERRGFYTRKSDRKQIQRFRCKDCGKWFSSATKCINVNQNRRDLNWKIARRYVGGMSQNRIAFDLGISKNTVLSKVKLMGNQALLRMRARLMKERKSENRIIYLDDLITFEHSRLKQVAVTVVTNEKRRILGFGVSKIPTSGKNAEIARKIYGPRPNELPSTLRRVMKDIECLLPRGEIIVKTDEHHIYSEVLNHSLVDFDHRQFKSERATISGYGEMKTKKRDPLFSINQTLAMLRDNMNRLRRRTWATTKCLKHLHFHLAIYAEFHNRALIA